MHEFWQQSVTTQTMAVLSRLRVSTVVLLLFVSSAFYGLRRALFHSNFDCIRAKQSCRGTRIVVLNGALQWRGTGAALSALPLRRSLELTGRARVSRPCREPAGRRRSVHERRSRAQARRARKFARAFWWRARTASATPQGLESFLMADNALRHGRVSAIREEPNVQFVSLPTCAKQSGAVGHDALWPALLNEAWHSEIPVHNCSLTYTAMDAVRGSVRRLKSHSTFGRDKFLLTWSQRAFTTCPQLHRNVRTQRILSTSRESTQLPVRTSTSIRCGLHC